MAETVVRGLRDLQAGFARADKESRLFVRKALGEAAEPVRRDAEALASDRIPRIGSAWARMRTGVTRRSVYVAPKKRGAKATARRRPNLAPLLMERAMQPALDRNAGDAERRVETALDRIADHFN